MKIIIEFKSVEEYLEFKEKTAQEGRVQKQCINLNIANATSSDLNIDYGLLEKNLRRQHNGL